MPHPDEGLIHAWLDGELDATKSARIEALVLHDPKWAAAAAEARGLIAASSRIAGALDRVPGKVIPKATTKPHVIRPWMARAAALVLITAGAVTLIRSERPDQGLRGPELPVPAVPNAGGSAPTSSASKELRAGDRPLASDRKATSSLKAEQKAAPSFQEDQRASAPGRAKSVAVSHAPRALAAAPSVTLRDKGTANTTSPSGVRGVLAEETTPVARERSAPAPQAAGTNAAAAGVAPSRKDAMSTDSSKARLEKALQFAAPRDSTRMVAAQRAGVRCLVPRQTADSAAAIVRLSTTALADSVRIAGLVERGDSLFDASLRFLGRFVQCP